MSEKFSVYVDWTLEDVSRPFYCGKGIPLRVRSFQRNRFHTRVKLKHGLRREVILETFDEAFAHEYEVQLIAELHLYVGDPLWNGIGTNLTVGGEGTRGHKSGWKGKKRPKRTPEHIAKLVASFHSTPKIPWNKGKELSSETCELISQRNKGMKHTAEERQAKSIRQRKAVQQLSLEGEVIATFETAGQASKTLHIKEDNIRGCCRGRRETSGGFRWKFV